MTRKAEAMGRKMEMAQRRHEVREGGGQERGG